jgi:hypothetical protein
MKAKQRFERIEAVYRKRKSDPGILFALWRLDEWCSPDPLDENHYAFLDGKLILPRKKRGDKFIVRHVVTLEKEI